MQSIGDVARHIAEKHAPARRLAVAPLANVQAAVQAFMRDPGAQHLASLRIVQGTRGNFDFFFVSHKFALRCSRFAVRFHAALPIIPVLSTSRARSYRPPNQRTANGELRTTFFTVQSLSALQ